eukprot:TRINITY_DN60630_c0_g1_i1.p2 TRINITY_DN60630_c0_g1~~TRINITY_DN60630_c0_g1_i1.p2  ORF type:complete len:153 (-),score=24.69 TRINITY_DN60630_c0_g1_i1:41-499(-)
MGCTATKPLKYKKAECLKMHIESLNLERTTQLLAREEGLEARESAEVAVCLQCGCVMELSNMKQHSSKEQHFLFSTPEGYQCLNCGTHILPEDLQEESRSRQREFRLRLAEFLSAQLALLTKKKKKKKKKKTHSLKKQQNKPRKQQQKTYNT